jgi:hypothetical protein
MVLECLWKGELPSTKMEDITLWEDEPHERYVSLNDLSRGRKSFHDDIKGGTHSLSKWKSEDDIDRRRAPLVMII